MMMTGHAMGRLFTLSTYGESHGEGIGAVVSGCPAGLALSLPDLQKDCDRRRPGQSRYVSGRRESDQLVIQSGLYQGVTTGAPIALWMENTDAKSKDYDAISDRFRPGHADYSYWQKFGIRDPRGGGRSSARETAMRVAAGGIAKQYLQQLCGLSIQGCVTQIGSIKADVYDAESIESNPFFFSDPAKVPVLEALLVKLRQEGNSMGARVQVRANRVPAGLGEPMYQRLDADLAGAMMSIPAVKGVEIGDGFAVVEQKGDQHRDAIHPDGFASNHAGGVLGGISTGQAITVQLALKPASSIRIPGETITHTGEPTTIVTNGRHDPCVGIRAVPVAEAMMAMVLMDHVLMQRARHPQQFEQACQAMQPMQQTEDLL